MRLLVRIDQAAEVEISEAAEFYDIESAGLGDAFTAEIESAIESISLHPNAVPLIRGGLRAKPLMKFPYNMVYSVAEAEIIVLAVAHQRRRPFYWISRL